MGLKQRPSGANNFRGPVQILSPPSGRSSEDNYDRQDDSTDDNEHWAEEDFDVDPSDSASGYGQFPRQHQPQPRQQPLARYPQPHTQPQTYYQQPYRPTSPPSTMDSEEYPAGPYAPRGYHGHQGHHGYGYGSGHAPPQRYSQAQGQYPGNALSGPNLYNYGGQGNSMVPMSYHEYNPNAMGPPGYFGHDQRYGMAPYQQPYYNHQNHQYGLPAHLAQMQISPPAGPPDVPKPAATPAPDDAKTKELEAQLAAFQKEKDREAEQKAREEREKKLLEDAERRLTERLEFERQQKAEMDKALADARAEAQRVARENIERENKAREEREKRHAEEMKKAEEQARARIEAEYKAAEERRKREEEARVKAEEAARIRVETEMRKEAEAKAAAEKKAAEELERLKQIQEDAKRKAEADAAAKVQADKEAAEKKAADAAQAAKDAEALKKKIQEDTKAKLEADAKKGEKKPIRFEDALKRKFSFPFHLCQTWSGMEELIKQAFVQVEELGPHVQEGRYDLIGPDGEIILPTIWEKVIQPDWQIKMTMWPIEKPPPRARLPPMAGGKHHGHGGHFMPMHGKKGFGGGGHGIPIPPPEEGWAGGRRKSFVMPEGIDVVDAEPPREKKKSKKHKPTPGLSFFGFSEPRKSSSSKKKSKK